MLKLLSDSNAVLNVDDFYIREQASGLDELIFTMSIYDENYPHVLEEAIIEYEQPYLVKAIDAGADTAKVKCQLDLDDLKATLTVGYSNGSNTLYGTVSGVLPAGWTFLDNSGSTISRTIEGNYTPLEVIQACVDTYGVVFRFDVKNKIVRAYTLTDFQPIGSFASRELNLTEVNFKGKSTDFYTRLYAYGKDGLSFADINNGLSYVDYNEYSNKVICAYWQDDRYTVAENLLAAAQEAVKTGGTPQRSYECSVYDLAATNPEMYSWQDFSLFSVVKLIDDIKGISLNYQVVERQVYPYYPEKNVVTLSSTAPKIQNTVKNIQVELENPNSNFRQSMQNLINSLAASITGEDGGNLRFTFNAAGQPNGIMIMDTEDESTARKILWLNLSGILYSSNGVNGPFDAVWSFAEGGFIADWIVAGTIMANIIKGGTLTLGGLGNGNGICQILDASGNVVGSLSLSGITATAGKIGGWNIGTNELTNQIGNNKVTIANGSNQNMDFLVVETKDQNGNTVYPFWVRANGQVGINLVDQSASTPAFTIGNVDGAAIRMGGDGFEVDFGQNWAKMYYLNQDGAVRLSIGNGDNENLRLDSDGMIQTKYPIRSSAAPNVHMNSAGTILECSDSTRRIKNSESDDLGDMDPEALYRLPVKTYKYNEGYLSDKDPRCGQRFIGFMAEDMEEVYPYAVDYDDDGLPRNWNIRVLVPAMMKLIQRQHGKIIEMEEKINEIISEHNS